MNVGTRQGAGRRGAAQEAPGECERVAALDVGSNSFHLLVVEIDGAGRVTVVDRVKEMVRLGASTLRDGVIPAATFQRGLASLRTLAARAAAQGARTVVAVGTSALRDRKSTRLNS